MSVTAMSWVFAHSPYSLGTRLVHLAVADVANEDHDWRVWASHSKIAAKAHVSLPTVSASLKRMVKDGYLEVLKADSRGQTEYRFLRPTTPQISEGSRSDPQIDTTAIPKSTQTHLLPTKEEQKGAPKRRTRIPDQFTLDAGDRAWASDHCPSVDLRAATIEFVTYWRGDGRPKADWKQTWRNSMLHEERRAAPKDVGPKRPENIAVNLLERDLAAAERSGDDESAEGFREQLRQQRTGAK